MIPTFIVLSFVLVLFHCSFVLLTYQRVACPSKQSTSVPGHVVQVALPVYRDQSKDQLHNQPLLRYSFNSHYDPNEDFRNITFSTWFAESQNITSTVSLAQGFPVNSPWYNQTYVCIDDSHGVKFFSQAGGYEESMASQDISRVGGPLHPVLLTKDAYSAEHVVYHLTKGPSLLVHCWSSWGSNPFHFLFGYGGLYSVLHHLARDSLSFRHVFIHQCPKPDHVAFFETFWEVLLNEGYAKGIFKADTRFYLSTRTELFCFDSIIDNSYSIPRYFGEDPGEHKTWIRGFSTYIASRWGLELNMLTSNEGLVGPDREEQPRIVIFERTEGMSGLRKMINLEQVRTLAAEFSTNIRVITVNGATLRAIDMILTFNSFDIFIATHGSQFANMLFTVSTRVVVIEVVPICINMITKLWLDHRIGYIISTGHNSTDEAVQASVDACRAQRRTSDTSCPFMDIECQEGRPIMDTDIIVNIDKLREALNLATKMWIERKSGAYASP